MVTSTTELLKPVGGKTEVTVGFGARTVKDTALEVAPAAITVTGPVTGRGTPGISGTMHLIVVSVHDEYIVDGKGPNDTYEEPCIEPKPAPCRST
jgi:hypothetical protein